MPRIPEGPLFSELLATIPDHAAHIAQLATEMQADHMDKYRNQVEGTHQSNK